MPWTPERAGKETTCPHCKGTGRIMHECEERHLDLLEKIYGYSGPASAESLGIYRCRVCGQLWMIRRQWDLGSGSDDIWLRPGEEKRGYAFSWEEAAKFEAVKQNA